MTVRVPDTYSAATTARVISRMLRRAGFPMARNGKERRRAPGVYAARVGYSNLVSVGYNTAGRWLPADREKAREVMAKAREFLAGKGYRLDDRGYITCEVD